MKKLLVALLPPATHASNGKVTAGWREALLEFPGRFLAGTASFMPARLFGGPPQ